MVLGRRRSRRDDPVLSENSVESRAPCLSVVAPLRGRGARRRGRAQGRSRRASYAQNQLARTIRKLPTHGEVRGIARGYLKAFRAARQPSSASPIRSKSTALHLAIRTCRSEPDVASLRLAGRLRSVVPVAVVEPVTARLAMIASGTARHATASRRTSE